MKASLATPDIIRRFRASWGSSHSMDDDEPSPTHRLDRTRVTIERASVRLPKDKKKPDSACIFFVIKVDKGDGCHVIEQSWAAFSELKEDLLTALDAGHACHGICPWLWEDLHHNFDYPTKKVNLRTWLHLRLRRRTKDTIQVFLEHFQELLDSMLTVLRQRHIHCRQFHDVCAVLARFIDVRPPTLLGSPEPRSYHSATMSSTGCVEC
ncbi:hypothetical protein SPRG_09151 [Saprolegnia parasitica CBS 223.65]|uniref:Uncharacterized protein n=1 Tax=Saprolegnia parasitica (strain CBS 223.65) TaxID=695850 RepID=A0A067C836_SAPPC|nr:hypothetical protein SPRG_09151 [Saprolegnia parasitica CBS 223.65]KDO25325.1 hypothetical protein SPRG_09151 [Saprolegnia parasitica CBS 223.65]|eukprot:XP_012203978.1 hypothetical protein SPRG_09151 [Saprolegnia parasitica CBS 223.65]